MSIGDGPKLASGKDREMTEIEAGYVAQGYELPIGYTWEQVDISRAKYGVDDIYVPIALASGCVGWGVPMKEGQFLSHP